MVHHKVLSRTRSVTIPKDMAAVKDIRAGAGIDLVDTEDGILIRNHLPVCRFCGSKESVGTVKGEEVCAKCAAEIRAEIAEKYK